jgi:peptidoglycan/LPS O-acetylase OafA/YrhL
MSYQSHTRRMRIGLILLVVAVLAFIVQVATQSRFVFNGLDLLLLVVGLFGAVLAIGNAYARDRLVEHSNPASIFQEDKLRASRRQILPDRRDQR